MAEYRFVSTWSVAAPIEEVWREVGDPLGWQNFWLGLNEVRLLEPGDADGKDAVYELVFKSFLPYTLRLRATVTNISAPRAMTMETIGELEGVAVFELDERDGLTSSTLTWMTRTNVPWMNAVAPLLRGLFEWNHDFLIRRAGEGLSKRLGTPIQQAEMSAPPLAVAAAPPVLVLVALVWLLRRALR